MKRIKQILVILGINAVILTVGIVIIELVFGGWWNPNKLNRLNLLPNCKRTYNVSILYKTANPIIKYTRDEYGLRGVYSDPSTIDILTVGGSTTDQQYIRDGETWQDVLKQQFTRQGTFVVVANAGVNGQSSFGHIKNFEWWFPNIPHLAPSFILFYVGINDFYKDDKDDGCTSDVLLRSNARYIKKSIRANSAILYLIRTLYGTYVAKKVNKISHRSTDFNKVSWTRDALQNDYEFMQPRLNAYANRLRILADRTFASGAKPIFVTQPTRKYRITAGGIEGWKETNSYNGHQYNGVDFYHMMKRLDRVTKAVAIEKNAYFVDLSSYANWEDADFYDFAHMTPPGANKVGILLHHAIKDIIVDAKTQKVRKE